MTPEEGENLIELIWHRNPAIHQQGVELALTHEEEDLPLAVRGYFQRRRLFEWAEECLEKEKMLPKPRADRPALSADTSPSRRLCPTIRHTHRALYRDQESGPIHLRVFKAGAILVVQLSGWGEDLGISKFCITKEDAGYQVTMDWGKR